MLSYNYLAIMKIRRRLKVYSDVPMTHQMVAEALAEYSRPNAKISELIRNDFLISLRRGLYVPGPEADLPIPHLYVIANHLRGPSYISLETALSYWSLIPEQVQEITSITLQTSHIYDTAIGRFSYRHLASPYYSFGLERVTLAPNQYALIASREKAICDKIITTAGVNLRSRKDVHNFLTEDLRIEEANLASLNIEMIESWLPDAPKRSSLTKLTQILRSL